MFENHHQLLFSAIIKSKIKSAKIAQIRISIKKQALRIKLGRKWQKWFYNSQFTLASMTRDCLNQNVEFENRCDSAEASYETLNSGVHHICLELCGKTLSKYDHTAASEQNSFSWKCDFSDILTLSPRFRSIFDDPSRDIWDAAYKQRGRQ